MYEPGRTGKHEHPYYPLHHSCHTTEHRTLTLICRDLNPDTAYILHYIYSIPHTRTARTGTHSPVPPRETYRLQRSRSVRHPHPAAHNPGGPPHQRPRHIRLTAHEPMPPPTTLTGGPTLLHRRLRGIRPHAHHQGGPPCSSPTPGDTTTTYDFTGENLTLLKEYPKSNFLDSNGMFFGFSAPKFGGVLMKTFPKPSFTHFFKKKWPPVGGEGFARFHQTWHYLPAYTFTQKVPKEQIFGL